MYHTYKCAREKPKHGDAGINRKDHKEGHTAENCEGMACCLSCKCEQLDDSTEEWI